MKITKITVSIEKIWTRRAKSVWLDIYMLFSGIQNGPQVESWSLVAQTQTTTLEALITLTRESWESGKLPWKGKRLYCTV